MKRNKILLLLIIFAIGFTSCEDWLDVSPKADIKSEVFYSHEAGYKDGLIGVYTLMTTPSSYGEDLTYTFLDVLAQYYDDLEGLYSMGNFRFAVNYNWESSKEESRLNAIWSRAFQAIANINHALKNIDKNKSVFSSESVYKVYKGEYLALRAYLHFDMLRLFAPSPAKGLNTLAIPYVDFYTSKAFPQLSIEDVVKKIEKDLKEAQTLMRECDPYGINSETIGGDFSEALKNRHYRMNYYAACALLARVYNYVGYKEKALEQAIELTGKSDGSSSIPEIFKLAEGVADESDMLFEDELIFCINKEDLEESINKYFFNERKDTWKRNVLSMKTERKNNIFEAEDSSLPYRASWVASTSLGSTYALSKYSKQKEIPMLKLSEMFLIAAECAETDSDALWYLNKIRKHRGLTPVSDFTKLNEEIYKEYRREFIGEGQLFYFYKRNLYNTIGSGDDVQIDVDKVYQIPLPKSELEFGKIN